MSNPSSSSSDVFKRLQISPSRNGRLWKPAMRLSPRRINRDTPYQYTPSRFESSDDSIRHTQSLDRASRLYVPNLSPTRDRSIKDDLNTERDLQRSPYNSHRFQTNRITRHNLLNKLEEEDETNIPERKLNTITNRNTLKNSRVEKTRTDLLVNKTVKFYLPNEGNINQDLTEIRLLLEEIVNRQSRIEKDISEIRLKLNIPKST